MNFNKENTRGRSMIEMLGVLAIIGVLTVVGIEGFGKAMEQFKINKAIGEYSYLIHGLIEHLSDVSDASEAGTTTMFGLVDVVQALNLVPQTWQKMSTVTMIDPYGNRIQPFVWVGKRIIVLDIYIGGTATNDDGAEVSQGFSPKFCLALFQNLVKPLSSVVKRASLYKNDNSGKNFYGDAFCNESQTCLRDLTLEQMNTACNSCSSDTACAVVLHFQD